MRPWPKLAAEARADKLGNDANALFRQTEHLREYAAHIEDRLRFLVEREHLAIPDCGCPLQLDGIMSLRWGDISLVELDWRAGERRLGIATLTLQATLWAVRGFNRLRIVLRF